ncbi:hypothetical protein B0T21DRAFT_200638 [Apiosordaria backusii]|uniref:Uncharacterized protein n=1 Tax=Apiosordaria backusii TaxID=314023 RepID=A0AA40BEG4_9PEZI|nr:hypothetical protein B0T21DRAFT_200638 [Apiosordaria backusii]
MCRCFGDPPVLLLTATGPAPGPGFISRPWQHTDHAPTNQSSGSRSGTVSWSSLSPRHSVLNSIRELIVRLTVLTRRNEPKTVGKQKRKGLVYSRAAQYGSNDAVRLLDGMEQCRLQGRAGWWGGEGRLSINEGRGHPLQLCPMRQSQSLVSVAAVVAVGRHLCCKVQCYPPLSPKINLVKKALHRWMNEENSFHQSGTLVGG